MDTRDTYWMTVHDLKFKEFYLQEYSNYAKTIDLFLNCFTSIASAGSIAGWAIWSKLTWLWGFIIIAAQVIQVLRPLLPYSRRIAAISFLLPDLSSLTLEAQTEWLRSQMADSVDYIALFHDFRMKYVALENKYLGTDKIPSKRRLFNRAEDATQNHLKLFFGASIDQGS